jgi:hypothetical protein
MIWRAIRHTTAVDLIAGAIFGLLVLLLSVAGVGTSGLEQGLLGLALFVGLCLVIYRLRYGRL